MDARLQSYEEKMKKTLDFLAEEYAAVRAGRANPHVLDKIKVDYYGTPTPIQQVGNVSVPEARIIQIAPWDKSMLKAIEKAILTEMKDDQVFLAARYSFDMPVLYEYVKSGFEDFEDFIDAISFDPSDD